MTTGLIAVGLVLWRDPQGGEDTAWPAKPPLSTTRAGLVCGWCFDEAEDLVCGVVQVIGGSDQDQLGRSPFVAGDGRMVVGMVAEVLASVVGVGGGRQLKHCGVRVHGWWQRTHGSWSLPSLTPRRHSSGQMVPVVRTSQDQQPGSRQRSTRWPALPSVRQTNVLRCLLPFRGASHRWPLAGARWSRSGCIEAS